MKRNPIRLELGGDGIPSLKHCIQKRPKRRWAQDSGMSGHFRGGLEEPACLSISGYLLVNTTTLTPAYD